MTHDTRTASAEPVRNEAAERLPRQFCSTCLKTTDDYVTDYKDWEGSPRRFHTCRPCVLAAERRATVERIRAGCSQVLGPCRECSNSEHIYAILDEESASAEAAR